MYYETAPDLSSDYDSPKPLREVPWERETELVELEPEPAITEVSEIAPKLASPMDRIPNVAKPTSDWEETFGQKVKKALKFVDTYALDTASEQKIRKLLVKAGYFPTGDPGRELERKDIAAALLLSQKGPGRLLTSDYTAAAAYSIIESQAAEVDTENP